MRPRIPFPSRGGDWRYDPIKGTLVDASALPISPIPAAPDQLDGVLELLGEPSEPVVQVNADDYEPETTEGFAERGETLPEITLRRARKRRASPQE